MKRQTSVFAIIAAAAAGAAGVLLFVPSGPSDAPNAVVARPAAAEKSTNSVGGKGIPPSSDYTYSAPPDANPAPTANLKIVSTYLQVKHKSVTVAVTLPAGLGITNPVEISALFGQQRVTQTYNNSAGNRLVANFAEQSYPYEAEVIITLAEARAGDNAAIYAIRTKVTIETLYDMTVSPLAFYLQEDCDDFGGDSEPEVAWRHPDGKTGKADFSLAGGETYQIRKFARTLQEVGPSSHLKVPTFAFDEIDFTLGDLERPLRPPNPLSESLHVGGDRRFVFTMRAQTDNFCAADFSYSISFRLLTYPGLT